MACHRVRFFPDRGWSSHAWTWFSFDPRLRSSTSVQPGGEPHLSSTCHGIPQAVPHPRQNRPRSIACTVIRDTAALFGLECKFPQPNASGARDDCFAAKSIRSSRAC